MSTDQTALVEKQSSLPASADRPDQAGSTAAVLDMIVRAATNPDVDVVKMERLMAMHDKIVERAHEGEFNRAMASAQATMRPVAADANNPQTRSKYASYAALDRMLRPVYTKHGFALSFDTGDSALENHVRVLSYVSHQSGFTRTYHVDMAADGKGAKGGDVMTKTHALGSAFTYGQRYLLKMIFNVAIGDDDDGNKAGLEPITAEQKEKIIELIRQTNADTRKFCAVFGVGSVDELPESKFDQAIQALEKKKRGVK